MATAPRVPTRRLSRPILAALCAVTAGCGGGNDGDAEPSDTQEIRGAVERVMESQDVRDQCETGASDRFVREVYVTLARCRRANRPDEDEEPDSATSSATRIDGDEATTVVTLTSVKGARATGRVALVKQDGTWKVDRLGVGFLRSIFAALPEEAATAGERRVLECLAQATRELSDAELRRFGNRLIGQQLTEESFPAAAVRCIRRGAPPATTA